MQSFAELNLPQSLSRALKAMHFGAPTRMQEKAIPLALDRRDLIGCDPAEATASGKAAAFCIPVISRLLKAPQKMALILVPSRAVALQIEQVLKDLSAFSVEIRTACVTAGMSQKAQDQALSCNPRIIVATPTALVENIRGGSISLSNTELLVLDGADQMLEMGFGPQLNEILRFLPRTRQTLLFAASLPSEIEKLASRFLKDAVRVTVEAPPQVPARRPARLKVARSRRPTRTKSRVLH